MAECGQLRLFPSGRFRLAEVCASRQAVPGGGSAVAVGATMLVLGSRAGHVQW
jgi:hypothetical protein